MVTTTLHGLGAITIEPFADLRYLVPIGRDFDFARDEVSIVGPDIKSYATKLAPSLGTRVGLRLWRNSCFLESSYHWYESTGALTIRQDNASLRIAGFSGTFFYAAGREHLTCQGAEVRWGLARRTSPRVQVEFFMTLNWTDLSWKHAAMGIELDDQTADFAWQGSLSGGGGGIGCRASYQLWRNIKVESGFQCIGYAGNDRTPVDKQRDGNSGLASVDANPSQVRIVPELCIDAGISCQWGRNGRLFTVKLGYELDYYWQALILPLARLSSRFTWDVGLGGICLRLGAQF